MARFYMLSIAPTLFGPASLVRHWGRIGTRGRTRIDLFADQTEAEETLLRLASAKRHRGYQNVDGGVFGPDFRANVAGIRISGAPSEYPPIAARGISTAKAATCEQPLSPCIEEVRRGA
jgi:predicted DNA-binding WGR domain protein